MKTDYNIVFLDIGTLGDDLRMPDFAALGKVTWHQSTRPEQLLERIKDADMLLSNKVVINAEHIRLCPKLKFISSLATGYNQIDIEAASARGIPVCNVPGYSTNSVVQYVFALVLSLYGHICRHSAAVREGRWAKSAHFSFWERPLTEIYGKTMGVAGFGAIGQGVCRLAHHFGMKVLAFNPHPKPAPDYARFAFVGLEELFAQADVVSLHCPLTPDNAGMVNSRLLGLMKKSALFINCARGGLVDEADLAAALAKGVIAGAGLDVVSQEPMPDDNPLRLAPHCIITPHVAWASTEARQRLIEIVFDNVRGFIDGKMINVCNGV